MSTKRFNDLKEILDADVQVMPDYVSHAWFGYLQAMYRLGELSLDEVETLSGMLGLTATMQTDLFDALTGGIEDRD